MTRLEISGGKFFVQAIISDRYGIVMGFYALGVFALGCAVAVGVLRRWAFRAFPSVVSQR